MSDEIKILILEDVLTDVELVLMELKKTEVRFQYLHVENEEDFKNALVDFSPDLILSDYMLPQFTGMEALMIVRKISSTLPFIIVTGSMNEEVAVECMKTGASDYVIKENLTRLESAIISSLEKQKITVAKIEAEKILKEKNIQIEKQNKELRQINADLQDANRKAVESDQLKTAFLHSISHEIRTPMNAIIGFSGLLGDSELTPDNRNEFINIIGQNCNQLLSIITDIVNIASIETGQEKMQVGSSDINVLCKQIYDQFIFKKGDKNISINFTTSFQDSDSIIITDETKLTTVLNNLLSNALKFTAKGFINFGYQLKNDFIEFYVEDTGIGIERNMYEEIFTHFRQVENTLSRQYEGTGIGLSISKAYVELMGGKIWLTSEMGKGSVFYFNIPYKKVIAEDDIITPSFYDNDFVFKTSKTILVAEDDETNLKLLKLFLPFRNITIIHALNGLEAVEICRSKKQVDLVLMDLRMPVMSGWDATMQIRELMPDLPIIAITAYSSEEAKDRAFASGCNDLISKPFRKELLFSKIKEQLKDS